MDEWKPIETCPHDGWFVAYWPEYRARDWMDQDAERDTYHTVPGQVLPAAWDGHRGRVYIGGNLRQPHSEPTHWQPIPEPPSMEAPEPLT
jgi:membrane peptidoglycan carboxypeptidase